MPSSPPQAVIRLAGPNDADALSALARATFTETFGHLYDPADLEDFLATSYAPGKLRVELDDPGQCWWIAEDGGRPVGYAHTAPCNLPHPDARPEHGELKRLYVMASHQGGVGRTLMAEALAWLEARHPGDLWLSVWSENHRAQRFYNRHGFEKAGEYEFLVGRQRDREFIFRRPA